MLSCYKMPWLVKRLLPQAVFTLPRAVDQIALTFDDGPDPEFTLRVLDVLARRKIAATFFVLGQQVEQMPALAREIADRGHTLGVHGYNHDSLLCHNSTYILEEINHTADIIEAATRKNPRLFRPPYGRIMPGALRQVTRAGWQVVLWDVLPYDFSAPSAARITQRAVAHTRAGSIVVLHDGGGDRTLTVEALPELIAQLAGCFRFVGLEGLEHGAV
jgi:peptidoglycan/xylan/chitin deacetylase (PgdA/CDA1 family)